MAQNDASVKEMECAAIANITEMFNIPFFAIKVITDIVDGGKITQEEFLENLGTAANSLKDNVPKVVHFVAGKKVNEL